VLSIPFSMTDLTFPYSSPFHSLPLASTRRTESGRLKSLAERRCTVSKKPTETPEPETPHSHKHPHQDPHPVGPGPAAEDASILKPIMDDLKGTTHFPKEDEVGAPDPAGPGNPPQPAELDQDPGGGYNPDGTYPQT
jgi:hypothetical protein